MNRIVAGFLIAGLAVGADMPIELRRLTGLAAGLPPEFQADALLQIVESRGGLDTSLKKDLLEQASAVARQARYPYRLAVVTGINADTRQAFQAKVSGLKLDRLSLEMRAVRDLLAIDPIAARVLFQQTQKPAPAAGTCADALIPQLDDYYEIAALVAARGFTPKEVAREDPVAFVLHTVTGMKAHYEIGPAARMIASARLTELQFQAALNAFTARLDSINQDDRAFNETGLATQVEMAALSARAAGSRATLGRAYRKYLVSHSSAPRCGDSASGRMLGAPLTSPIDWFNQSDLRGDQAPIELKDVRSREAAGPLQLNPFWTTQDSAQILAHAQALRTSPGGVSYSLAERAASEWQQQLQDFLAQLNDWKQADGESDLDFFHQKATVYEALIDVCPPSNGRQRLIGAFTGFLKNSEASPVDCFWHAENLYRRLRQAGDADASKLMAAYRASGSLLLGVYAQFN